MKKITLILIICFTFSFNSHAQLFSEDFTAITTNWQGTWQVVNQDGDTAPNIWFQSGNLMGSFSNDGTQRFPDHYAVTPLIDVTGASGLFLNYKAGSLWPAPNEGEVFTVYASTGNVVPDDFINPAMNGETTISSGIIDLATIPTAQGMLDDFNLDLSALDGATEIYIAFRHHSTPINQGRLHIDDVVLTATLGIGDNVFTGFKLFIDSRNILQLSSNNKNIEGITIYNLLGQNVLKNTLTSTKASINLSSLHSGVYIAQVTIDGTVNSFKILKK